MTRARDRLFVFGCPERGDNENWHKKLYEIAQDAPGAAVDNDGIITIESGEKLIATASEKTAKDIENTTSTEYYNILKNLDFSTNHRLNDLSVPHRPVCAGMTKVSSELLSKNALEYGINVHKQLELLNLDAGGPLAEKILSNPETARFFAPGSRAEVPIAGEINGEFHSFRIDRMIVSETAVEILDYKTDRTRESRDVYAQKLADYASMLARIYPGREIRAFILWLCDLELDRLLPPC